VKKTETTWNKVTNPKKKKREKDLKKKKQKVSQKCWVWRRVEKKSYQGGGS